jgi:hypothetical protein
MTVLARRPTALAERLRVAGGLRPAEWGLLVEALLLNLAMPVLVRAVPLDRLAARLARASGAGRAQPLDASRAARIVECASARLLGATCLTRSLVLYRMLGRRGAPVTIEIGTRHEGSRFLAHAWVRVGGTVAFGGPAGEYATIWTATAGTAGRGGRG